MAPKMAGEISQQTGWKIKRVSLKPRNDARAIPDAWEKAALEDFDMRAAAGEPPAKLEKGEKVGSEYRFVKALPVQPLCLSCHGSCLLYTSDAADERSSVDFGGRRIIKKKNRTKICKDKMD